MKLIGLFAFGFFAAIVTAMPAPTDDKDPKTPACELSGMVYNGAGKECQCPPGQEKKPNRGKCGYKPFPQPHCGHEEKPYCSKSKHEYCHYGMLLLSVASLVMLSAHMALHQMNTTITARTMARTMLSAAKTPIFISALPLTTVEKDRVQRRLQGD